MLQTNFEAFNWTSISVDEAHALYYFYEQIKFRYNAVVRDIFTLLTKYTGGGGGGDSASLADKVVIRTLCRRLTAGLDLSMSALSEAISVNQFGIGLRGFGDEYGP